MSTSQTVRTEDSASSFKTCSSSIGKFHYSINKGFTLSKRRFKSLRYKLRRTFAVGRLPISRKAIVIVHLREYAITQSQRRLYLNAESLIPLTQVSLDIVSEQSDRRREIAR